MHLEEGGLDVSVSLAAGLISVGGLATARDEMDSNGGGCRVAPSVWLLLITLLITAGATGLLCAAIMTDYWEILTWDRRLVQKTFASRNNRSQQIDWLVDGRVARIVFGPKRKTYDFTTFESVDSDPGSELAVFLVPMHGGIWTFCVSLNEEERQLLSRVGFTQTDCIDYLSADSATSKGEEGKADWQHRMQNLSISCAMVCLIILCSAALVGLFGILKHQISAVLVTGVMYLLAATFATFTLTILHFKRQPTRTKGQLKAIECGGGSPVMLADGVSVSARALQSQQQLDVEYLTGRIFSTGWSLDLGWSGVGLCLLTSMFWILLSKIMRYNPLSTTVQ